MFLMIGLAKYQWHWFGACRWIIYPVLGIIGLQILPLIHFNESCQKFEFYQPSWNQTNKNLFSCLKNLTGLCLMALVGMCLTIGFWGKIWDRWHKIKSFGDWIWLLLDGKGCVSNMMLVILVLVCIALITKMITSGKESRQEKLIMIRKMIIATQIPLLVQTVAMVLATMGVIFIIAIPINILWTIIKKE